MLKETRRLFFTSRDMGGGIIHQQQLENDVEFSYVVSALGLKNSKTIKDEKKAQKAGA